jgi:hypothetical protein
MKRYYLAEKLGEQEYTVNGVRYIVGSCFQSSKAPTSTTIHDRFKRIVSSDTVPLSVESTDDTMESEYVCSTAGKEDN